MRLRAPEPTVRHGHKPPPSAASVLGSHSGPPAYGDPWPPVFANSVKARRGGLTQQGGAVVLKIAASPGHRWASRAPLAGDGVVSSGGVRVYRARGAGGALRVASSGWRTVQWQHHSCMYPHFRSRHTTQQPVRIQFWNRCRQTRCLPQSERASEQVVLAYASSFEIAAKGMLMMVASTASVRRLIRSPRRRGRGASAALRGRVPWRWSG
jgi:hypothetical protein